MINSWLRKEKKHPANPRSVAILTMMTLEKFMGYSFDEINRLYGNGIPKGAYEAEAKRLEFVCVRMVDHLSANLIHYRKVDSADLDRCNLVFEDGFEDDEDDRSDQCSDWYACNSVDRTDGSKYLGYLRREHEERRFGSFPVHDDYGDESWPDDTPWE